MARLLSLRYMFVSIIVIHGSSSQGCTPGTFTSQDNTDIDRGNLPPQVGVLRLERVTAPSECIGTCHKDVSCLGCAWNDDGNMCDVITDVSDTQDLKEMLVPAIGWIVYAKEQKQPILG